MLPVDHFIAGVWSLFGILKFSWHFSPMSSQSPVGGHHYFFLAIFRRRQGRWLGSRLILALLMLEAAAAEAPNLGLFFPHLSRKDVHFLMGNKVFFSLL